MMTTEINIGEFDYSLPKEKIAFYPVEHRNLSKLLVYSKGTINTDKFDNIGNYFPDNAWLIFNDTKVVKARILFEKDTQAKIELFCLEPVSGKFTEQFLKKNSVEWKCLVGNSRRWKDGVLTTAINVEGKNVVLKAQRIETNRDYSVIRFYWQEDITFSNILEHFGKMPLPPYIEREAELSDINNYQTVYAAHNGSVAAPTAGLHFTSDLIHSLSNKNVSMSNVTLHVGAGTFKPVSTNTVNEHVMHPEKMIVKKHFVEKVYTSFADKYIIPVGTTSCRYLESLYWFGVKVANKQINNDDFVVEQWYPYQYSFNAFISVQKSMESILNFMEGRHLSSFEINTSLIIIPSYKMAFSKAIITNFHQPKSTLLLIIASAIGKNWKLVYDYALKNNFRFLSYGDSCFLVYD